MLKGHVFSKQLFGNPIFAVFINTFLNGQNGVSNNYKNGMAITYSGSTVTVDTGAVCIQGRFLEEDTSTTISAGTDNAYCKLIIEIDLDKQNTETEFLQSAYKIVKSGTGYPTLTQTDIVKNDAGVYQYELARFITNASGISEFSDRRTFLDFKSIYNEIQQHIQNIDDGSLFLQKDSIAILTGTIELTGTNLNSKIIEYPSEFNNTNSIVLAHGIGRTADDYNYGNTSQDTSATFNGNPTHFVRLKPENIQITAGYGVEGHTNSTLYYKIVLMRVS